MYKCGWSHCEKVYIYDTDEKTKVGKRWYHAECAKERETIQDIITKFIEYVDENVDVIMLRKIVNELIFTNNYPAEYVMFALDYALQNPFIHLNYPGGLYKLCRSSDIMKAWKEHQDKEFMKTVDNSQFVAKDVEVTPLNHKPSKTGGFGSILWKKGS